MPLDTLDPEVHPIEPIRHIGILVLKIADALLDLADIVAHVINCAADVAQMLKNDVVCLGPVVRLSSSPSVVNDAAATVWSGDLLHRVSFLYFTRCGMMES